MPSDTNPQHFYGKKQAPTSNINDILSQNYAREWIIQRVDKDNQLEEYLRVEKQR